MSNEKSRLTDALLALMSRALWCVGMALLLIGTVLVSEATAFADPGDVNSCDQMCQQGPEDPVYYENCMDACTGTTSIDFCYLVCTRPNVDCPSSSVFGGCVNNRCYGKRCPTACRCYIYNITDCQCRKNP